MKTLFDSDKNIFTFKKNKKIYMIEGIVTIDYIKLVWMNLKGVSFEIHEKLSGDETIKYRINQENQIKCFKKSNSNIRKNKDDIVTITYSGEAHLHHFGDVRFSSFSIFKMELEFEMSNFELDI